MCIRDSFDTTMRAWAEERLSIEVGVREALTNNGLTVAYQPRIDLTSGQMTSVEALLRWPQEPTVPVSRIIDVAEASGLISAVGRFVLHRACHDIAALNRDRATEGPISVAVNVSMLQLSQHDLETDTRESLASSGLDPVLLTLELTETFLAEDPDAAKRTLDELSALGVRLEIDDFGTGYSSLARLAHFPLHGLKIDRSFITSVEEDSTARSLVESIVTLARALDLEVTAEGIETTLQADVVKDVGCDLAQGFLYARPMSFEDLREFTPERTSQVIPAGGYPTAAPHDRRPCGEKSSYRPTCRRTSVAFATRRPAGTDDVSTMPTLAAPAATVLTVTRQPRIRTAVRADATGRPTTAGTRHIRGTTRPAEVTDCLEVWATQLNRLPRSAAITTCRARVDRVVVPRRQVMAAPGMVDGHVSRLPSTGNPRTVAELTTRTMICVRVMLPAASVPFRVTRKFPIRLNRCTTTGPVAGGESSQKVQS